MDDICGNCNRSTITKEESVHVTNTKPASIEADQKTAGEALVTLVLCTRIKSFFPAIFAQDVNRDVDKASDKEVKDLAAELHINVPSNERHLLVARVRAELPHYFTEALLQDTAAAPPASLSPSTSSSGSIVNEFEIKKCEPLINFKSDNCLVVKEQFIQFVSKAGQEKCSKKGEARTASGEKLDSKKTEQRSKLVLANTALAPILSLQTKVKQEGCA